MSTSFDSISIYREVGPMQSVWVGLVSTPEGRVCLGTRREGVSRKRIVYYETHACRHLNLYYYIMLTKLTTAIFYGVIVPRISGVEPSAIIELS